METQFKWGVLSNVTEGRENLGNDVPISVYRLFEFSMRATLQETYGNEACIEIFRKAGYRAGKEFAEQNLDLSLDANKFVSNLQHAFAETKMGILRFEELDLEKGTATITVSEDVDCSGLPIIGETVCNYEEGFISAILSIYTKKEFETIEIDCWAKGDRICRFKSNLA